MSRYRPISIRIWGDDKFCSLSRPQPNGQSLWLYLITGPHTTAIPGAFVAGEAALAESLNWPIKSFQKVFAEVLGKGMAEVDKTTRLVFLPKAVIHNPPQSPNVVIAWRKSFNELPDCALKARIYSVTIANIKALGLGEAYVKAFGEAFTYTLLPPFAESEQEQEQNRTGTEREGEDAAAPLLSLGEFGRCVVTHDELRKLKEHLGAHLDDFIGRFDRWVDEAPDAKAGGVRRRDRSPYKSIRNWYDKDSREGKLNGKQRQFKTTAETKFDNNNAAFAAAADFIASQEARRGGGSGDDPGESFDLRGGTLGPSDHGD